MTNHEIYRQFRDELTAADGAQLHQLTDMLHSDRSFANAAGPEFVRAADAALLMQEVAA